MLYGRDAERSRIGELLDGARESRSSALVIAGEAGVGKSALLEDACDQAGDMLVLRGSGVESEAHLPFAALHQLVRPVLGLVDNLPQPQAAALRGALGLAAGVSDDRFLVSLAALSLLSETAEDEPLLCLSSSAVTLDRMPWWLPGGALAAGVVLLPIGIVTLRRTIRVRRSSA